jgi:Spy/CpxP family protein refolding chaperone
MMILIAAALAAAPAAAAPATAQGPMLMPMPMMDMGKGGHVDEHKGMDCCKDCGKDMARMHDGRDVEAGAQPR